MTLQNVEVAVRLREFKSYFIIITIIYLFFIYTCTNPLLWRLFDRRHTLRRLTQGTNVLLFYLEIVLLMYEKIVVLNGSG